MWFLGFSDGRLYYDLYDRQLKFNIFYYEHRYLCP